MKTILTTGWHFMRIVRLVLGIIWMIFAYMQHDGLIGLAGGFLVFTALFNYGCCGSNGCAIPQGKQTKTKNLSSSELIQQENQ